MHIRSSPTLLVIEERNLTNFITIMQQEPRLLTHLSGDPKLTETYNNNLDLYATIGSLVFKKDYWECMEHWEDGTPNPVGKGIRKKCKSLVLGKPKVMLN